ncbi:CidA/LrgA family protein [Colwellia sp. RSH04]|nr:CidA/LrgA family protein [Colwellia sp. RSH04]
MKNALYTLCAISVSLLLGKLTYALIPFVPASLYGMVFYCLMLHFNIISPIKVEKVNLWLVRHMGVCFVPAGVGIINHFDLIKLHGIAILIIIFVSTFTLLTVVAWCSEKIFKAQQSKGNS